MPRSSKLNRKAVEEGFEAGLSMREIARRLDVHPTTVYYALHPERRAKSTTLGRQRSAYVSDELWSWLSDSALEQGKSKSEFLTAVLAQAKQVDDG